MMNVPASIISGLTYGLNYYNLFLFAYVLIYLYNTVVNLNSSLFIIV